MRGGKWLYFKRGYVLEGILQKGVPCLFSIYLVLQIVLLKPGILSLPVPDCIIYGYSLMAEMDMALFVNVWGF